jgi:cytochrome c
VKLILAVSLLVATVVIAGCNGDAPAAVDVPDGDPDAGRELIMAYQCGECHRIPGVDGAEGRTAPGLQVWPNRAFVAGGLPNTPENVMRFIQDPSGTMAGSPMPDLGVSEEEARHITAYLFTLR